MHVAFSSHAEVTSHVDERRQALTRRSQAGLPPRSAVTRLDAHRLPVVCPAQRSYDEAKAKGITTRGIVVINPGPAFCVPSFFARRGPAVYLQPAIILPLLLTMPIVFSAGNPASGSLPLEIMQGIVRFCVKNGLVLMADEVYQVPRRSALATVRLSDGTSGVAAANADAASRCAPGALRYT